MTAWFEGSPKSLLVLAEFEGADRLVWHSAQREAITTQGPFVVRSIGTDFELRDASYVPRLSDIRGSSGRKMERVLDVMADGKRSRFLVRARFRAGPLDDVELLGQPRRLRRFVETVSAGGTPRYRNDYWIDESDGFCWKSRQIVVPGLPHLNIEVTKRPARTAV